MVKAVIKALLCVAVFAVMAVLLPIVAVQAREADPCPPQLPTDPPWKSGATTATFSPNGTLTVSGSGAMATHDYCPPSRPPWQHIATSITRVIIEEGVTHIGANAFYGHTGLTTITIPHSVKSIGWRAFENCTALTSITSLNPSPPRDGFEMFAGLPKSVCLYVPTGKINAYRNANGWKIFKCIKDLAFVPTGE